MRATWPWTIGSQATVLNTAPGQIVYRFHARDLALQLGDSLGKKRMLVISLGIFGCASLAAAAMMNTSAASPMTIIETVSSIWLKLAAMK